MYKIKICATILLVFVFGILCLIKFTELSSKENQKNRLIELKKHINKFSKKVKEFSFPYLKPNDKFFEKNYCVKKSIEKISKKLIIKKVLIKSTKDFEEIRLLTYNEQTIYNFIESLIFELPGIVQFKIIEITKNNDDSFLTTLQFNVLLFDNFYDLVFMNKNISNQNEINLFGSSGIKSYKLLCTINNSKAYIAEDTLMRYHRSINNFWAYVGDVINSYKLINIGQNFIKIQDDNSGRKIVIRLGDCW